MTKEELEQWVDDLQSGMYINCVYCGHRYGPNSVGKTTMRKALGKHISKCPKHPLSAAKAEITVLKESVESWKREYRLINAAQIAAEERVKELEAAEKHNSILKEAQQEWFAKIEQMEATISLIHDANTKAVAMWKEAHPDDKFTWPDQAELVCWLMDQLNDAMKAVEVLDDDQCESFHCQLEVLKTDMAKYKAFWEYARLTDKMNWERNDWPKHDLYTVSRCRKDDKLYGKVHMAESSQHTLCGLEINENWWLGYFEDLKVTCKKCLYEYGIKGETDTKDQS